MADSNITKNVLASALKKLMKEKGFEKISVSEICEECGMNRKSFYYHFKDKYDLANWIFYEDFLKHLQAASYADGWEAMQDLCENFYADRDFYLEALKIGGQNSFRGYVTETIRPLVIYFTQDIFDEGSEKEFFDTYFADAILNTITHWLQDDTKLSPEDFVKSMRNVLTAVALRNPQGDEKGEQPFPARR